MVFLESVVYVSDRVFPCNCCGFCFQQLLFSTVSHLEPRNETSFLPRQGSAGKRRVSTCFLSPTAKPTHTAQVRVRASGWKGKPNGRWVGSIPWICGLWLGRNGSQCRLRVYLSYRFSFIPQSGRRFPTRHQLGAPSLFFGPDLWFWAEKTGRTRTLTV